MISLFLMLTGESLQASYSDLEGCRSQGTGGYLTVYVPGRSQCTARRPGYFPQDSRIAADQGTY